jgi:hypothetical protein
MGAIAACDYREGRHSIGYNFKSDHICVWLLVWFLGLVWAVLGGYLLVPIFLAVMRDNFGIAAAEQPDVQRVSPKLTGVLERAFFCIAVGADIGGALTAMFAWLALKLAANWQARPDRGERLGINYYTFSDSALLAGMLSLLIAMLGGLFIRKFT